MLTIRIVVMLAIVGLASLMVALFSVSSARSLTVRDLVSALLAVVLPAFLTAGLVVAVVAWAAS
jgi:hypothetical protein